MRKITVLSLFLLSSLSFFAQTTHRCGTKPPSEHHFRYAREVISKLPSIRNTGTTSIPLKAHVFRKDDGSSGVTNTQLNTAISYLNYHYLNAGVTFFWCETPSYIDNTDLWDYNEDPTDGDNESNLTTATTELSDAVNIFFVDTLELYDIPSTSSFKVAGYAYYPSNTAASNRVVMTNGVTDSYDNGTFAHEFGHYLGLFHTHEGTESGKTAPNAENVARSGANANCSTNGDLLCDTPADPKRNNSNFAAETTTYDIITCTYTGNATDQHGATYTPDLGNIMSYYHDRCGGAFTAEQSTRIAQGLSERLSHTTYSLDHAPMTVIAPTALTATFNTGTNGIDLAWTDNAANEMGYLIERSSTSATEGFQAVIGGATDADITSFSDNSIAANTTYWYRVKASNGDTYSNVVTITTGRIYCTPLYTNHCFQSGNVPIAIDDITIWNQDKTDKIENLGTNCTGASYSNFSLLDTVTLSAGKNHEITIAPDTYNGSNFGQSLGVWIDLNQDGDFEDVGELIHQDTLPSSAPSGITELVQVPIFAQNGYTTLRIRTQYYDHGDMNDACAEYSFGEAEDYTVEITGGIPSAIPTAVGTYVADYERVCDGWTYYVDDFGTPSDTYDDLLLLAIEKDGTLDVDASGISVGVTGTGAVKVTAPYVTQPDGWYVMNRYWNVNPTIQPSLSGVNVRTYYHADDYQAVYDTVIAKGGTLSGHDDLVFFKFQSGTTINLDPNSNHAGATADDYIELTSTQSNYADDFQTEFHVTSFSGGGGGAANLGGGNGALPVELVDFLAKANGASVSLSWTTLSERNSDHFELERSDDGLSFHKITELNARGTNTQAYTYRYQDHFVPQGTALYRLRQVDLDGSSTYSNLLYVQITYTQAIKVAPNPFDDQLSISIHRPERKEATFALFTLTGKQVFKTNWNYQDTTPHKISLPVLTSGVYLYEISDGYEIKRDKLIKQ